MAQKVLIIEDELQISEIVAKYLEKAGYLVMIKENGINGLEAFAKFAPDILILDVMMPGISGYDVLSQVRVVSDVPIIMLTAKYQEGDRIAGFDLGADDYVTKPFSPKELVKRVNAVLRRSSNSKHKDILKCGELYLDTKKQKLFKNNDQIDITSKEFMVIKTLFENQDNILTRQQIMDISFGYDYFGMERNIDTYIKNIRHKIEEDPKNPEYLKTKYGAGYVMERGKNEN